MCFTSGGRHQHDAKCSWGVTREIVPVPPVVAAAHAGADTDEDEVRARFESWRDIERAVVDEERRAKAYERLERELRSY